MAAACSILHGHGRGGVLFLFFLDYHGRDGARTTRRSHHGRDNSREMKNTLIHYSSRLRGGGKMNTVAVTAMVTGMTNFYWLVTGVTGLVGADHGLFWNGHGRDHFSGCLSPCRVRP